MKVIPVALTIAGSDSGGGAGIQADLKTFAALGVHGTCAITAITAQNTYSVTGVQEIDTALIEKQIEAVAEDLGVDAAKTGMLSSSGIITAVARSVRRYGFPLVVDPVMVAKSGAPLLQEEAVSTLVSELLPLAKVVTPNIPEAERLSGRRIEGVEDMKVVARLLAEEYGAEAVVIKGGHSASATAIDVLYYRGSFWEFSAERIETKNTHGTGCTFSAAITAELAKGKDIVEAVKKAKDFVTMAIKYSLPLGRGHGPVNPIAALAIDAERYRVLHNVSSALRILEEHGKSVAKLVPECQMNIAMSLPKHYARGVEDVAGVPGRIVKLNDSIKASSAPAFGASRHVARAVLKIMEYDPEVRAAANIRFSEEVLRILQELSYSVSYYDRREEPPEVKRVEGATIPWGVETAVRRAGGRVPRAIYHTGDWGKEPMILLFGKDAVEVANMVVEVAKRLGGEGSEADS
ncbi:bifunctional hydroxymethylpyrimidine kinase/phosphomethylpyrimidine kinase [Infirmifilum lucidum]|uniref:Bifunctional hydroxymethylpyrimidine kinase/phosphomethylpyrimidine kinase n=1 Tax=Infirmifilum lucidum TaxID=2776706 RepID=A0A7L9FGG2_9CREN|nr:bifunctional hydroxymethylpyrimidine kinase/phosphomethylpyrimidine kinase [Infirmifilum lucidum]QOJ78711.1 bifunctional hydroxymethylpyrimidine kinase/phosphomethylpyrimidine kinase [Infirmifilum lucidum]